jgi:hypothetical protein
MGVALAGVVLTVTTNVVGVGCGRRGTTVAVRVGVAMHAAVGVAVAR